MTENLSHADSEDQVLPAGRGAGLTWLVIVVALGSLGASGWLWWQGAGKAQREVEHFTAELHRQEQLLARIDERSGALETQLSALLGSDPAQRLDKLEQDLGSRWQSIESWKSMQDETAARVRSIRRDMDEVRDRLAAAEAALTAVSARSLDGSAELRLAEIDYLLRLAQERLVLFGDSRSADQALEIAGQHVAALDNPAHIGLRRAIDSARQTLSAWNLPDYQTLERKLASLQSSVGQLPLRREGLTSERPLPAGDSGWWKRLRNAFSGLVTVRPSSRDEMNFPALADQDMLRQSAWLELEVARWAALRRDQEAFAAALKRFSITLEDGFETTAQGSREAAEILRELRLLNVDPPVPDISAPWTALQALRGPGMSPASERNPAPPATKLVKPAVGTDGAEDSEAAKPGSGDADR